MLSKRLAMVVVVSYTSLVFLLVCHNALQGRSKARNSSHIPMIAGTAPKSEVPKFVRRVKKTTNEELRARKVTNETQDSHARAPSRPPVTMVDIGCSQSKDIPETAMISPSGEPQPFKLLGILS